jgi:hypothetical protein
MGRYRRKSEERLPPPPPAGIELAEQGRHPAMSRLECETVRSLYGREVARIVADDLLHRGSPLPWQRLAQLARNTFRRMDAADTSGFWNQG